MLSQNCQSSWYSVVLGSVYSSSTSFFLGSCIQNKKNWDFLQHWPIKKVVHGFSMKINFEFNHQFWHASILDHCDGSYPRSLDVCTIHLSLWPIKKVAHGFPWKIISNSITNFGIPQFQITVTVLTWGPLMHNSPLSPAGKASPVTTSTTFPRGHSYIM